MQKTLGQRQELRVQQAGLEERVLGTPGAFSAAAAAAGNEVNKGKWGQKSEGVGQGWAGALPDPQCWETPSSKTPPLSPGHLQCPRPLAALALQPTSAGGPGIPFPWQPAQRLSPADRSWTSEETCSLMFSPAQPPLAPFPHLLFLCCISESWLPPLISHSVTWGGLGTGDWQVQLLVALAA